MPTRTIYLPDEVDAAITAAVDRGEYDNRSKAIQDALREKHDTGE